MSKKKNGQRLKKLIGLRSAPQGMTYGDLDPKIEQPIVCAIAKHGPKGVSIAEIGVTCFITRSDRPGAWRLTGRKAKNHAQANSWARNALRRPLREGIVERVSPGVYRMTRRGRNQVSK